MKVYEGYGFIILLNMKLLIQTVVRTHAVDRVHDLSIGSEIESGRSECDCRFMVSSRDLRFVFCT